MKELFNTISEYLNQFVTWMETLFQTVKDSITEMQYWIDLLPAGLIASAAIILVLLVIFRILGR